MNRIRFIAGNLAVIALALTLGACSKSHETSKPETLPTARVRIATIQTGSHPAREEIMGTVRAKLRAVIEAKVSGRVAQLPVAAGQRVKAGELLVEIDAGEVKARLDQTRAASEQADAELKRYTALLEQGAATRAEFDSIQARQRIARATVAEAETMVGYSHITAPFDGVISRKWVDVGDLAAPGKALVDMEDPAHLRLEANVPETLIQKLQRDSRLPVRVDSVTNKIDGVVTEIAPSSDPGSRTFLVKLDLPAIAELRAGQFGRVSIPIDGPSALGVPASALIVRGQMEIVFIVADNRVQLRLVKTGKRIGNEIELVSGVEPGEIIVTEGAAGLVDGQPVETKQ